MTSRRTRGLLAAGALALAALGVAPFVAPTAAQEEERKTSLLRGPFVSTDAPSANGTAATNVDVIVARGETEVTLLASWRTADGSTTTRSVPFAAGPGSRLRARIEAPPATSVSYDVVAASGSLARATLETLPAVGTKKLAFCALGDSGFGRRGDGLANENQLAIARLLEQQRPDLVIHTGDIIYLAGQPLSFDPLFFKPYAGTLARVPYCVTLGNHDVKTRDGKHTLEDFPFPSNQNGNRYYSFDAANVHFTCLDSNEVEACETLEKFLATDQGKWLGTDLAATSARWKVVYCHFPLISVNKGHTPETTVMRHILEKFLDDKGVDLVVNGHDHFYHRSVRLRSYKASKDGVVHVITGGGGAPLYKGEPRHGELTAAFESRFHLTRFDVDGASMRIRAIGVDAKGEADTFDDATITSRKGP